MVRTRQSDGDLAVTVAIAKKEGSNGVTVANDIRAMVESLKGRLIPEQVHVEITRNYGDSAQEKVNELLFKLVVATGIVTILVWWALGLKPAIVVTVVIPVVILMTVFAAFVMGFSIDRVSLFALIFSIGILVDDAIVVVENIYRRWLMEGEPSTADCGRRGARGRQPDHPGDIHRGRGTDADGLRQRPDGPLHGADPGTRLDRHDHLAVRRVRVHLLSGDAHPAVDGTAGKGRAGRTRQQRKARETVPQGHTRRCWTARPPATDSSPAWWCCSSP